MTKEDYEKMYKDALERAKHLTSDLTTLQAIREFIFPELRESEDERIRKTLIHIVKGACDKYGIKYQGKEIGEEKLLAWLEKKGKQQ